MSRDRAWLIKNHFKVYRHMMSYSKDLLDRKFPSSLKYHTLESCKESALLYNSRLEWVKGDVSSYNTACKNKWLEECCVHMVAKYKSHTLESCKESALLYKNRNEWKKADENSYQTARRNKWLEECCVHMSDSVTLKKEVVRSDGKVWSSCREAGRYMGSNSRTSIRSAIKTGNPYKGFTFKYK